LTRNPEKILNLFFHANFLNVKKKNASRKARKAAKLMRVFLAIICFLVFENIVLMRPL